MAGLRRFLLRMYTFLLPARAERELSREVAAHLRFLEEHYRRRGMAADEARRAARRTFGGVDQMKERSRAVRSFVWLEDLRRDLWFGARTLRKAPAFTVVALLTLAIGIGANTAVFSVVNGVLIKPLPYPQPDALVGVWHSAQFQSVRLDRVNLSSTMYLTYREHNRTFQEFGVWHYETASVTGIGEPEEVRALVVTHGTLPAVGVRPALGRWFSQADDSPGTPETVILTHGYWQRRFGRDRSVIGRAITIDSRPREVIGVMPRRFRFLDADPEVILPQRFQGAALLPNDVHRYSGIIRLEPGVSLAQANDDVARMLPVWIAEYGTSREVLEAAGFAPALRPLKQDVVGDVGYVLWVLMGTIGIVLLVACANVANLLLVRAEGRRQELAIRAALGAGWGRIARAALVESMALGVLGGALGLGLAYGGLRLLVVLGPANLPRLAEVSIDPLVMAFTLVASVLSGLVFGLVPVVQYARPRMSVLHASLRGGGRTASSSRERHRSQNALVVVQVALALVLLVAAGLMIRSFQALRNVQPGFSRPERVQTVRIQIPEAQVETPERVVRMQHDILEQMATIDGVTSVAFASALPIEVELENNVVLTAQDKTYAEGIPPLRRSKVVSPGLFETLGIPLVAGRDFTWTDVHGSREVAIVSENMAREMWDEPLAALGKRVRMGTVGVWHEIVGVVGDVYDSGVHQKPPTIVYWGAGAPRGMAVRGLARALTFAIRSDRTDTDDFLRQVRERVWAVNPNLPLAQVRTLGDVYDASMSRTSFTLVMLAIAGTMALALSVVGIYGVMSYGVSRRTREIVIRLALGARQGDVKWMFVRQALALAGVGLLIGLGAAAGLTRVMSSLLFEISPLDPMTYILVPLLLAMAVVLACYLPARRAAAVDLVEALKGVGE